MRSNEKTSRRCRGLCRFLSTALLAVALSAPDSIMSQAIHEIESLSLSLETEMNEYDLGEPVYLTVRLSNRGRTPVRVQDSLHPSDGLVHIAVVRPDGSQAGFIPLSIVDIDQQLVELAPGAEIAATFPVFYGGLGWTLRTPGIYSFAAGYEAPVERAERISLRSESLSITVRSDNTEAGEFLMAEGTASDEAGKFLTWNGGDHLTEGIARLQSLIERFPASPVSAHASFALGKSLSDAFMDYSEGRVREPECGRALEYLQQVRVDRVPGYLKIQTGLAQARCHLALGEMDRAGQRLQEVRVLVGDRAEFRGFVERLTLLGRRIR